MQIKPLTADFEPASPTSPTSPTSPSTAWGVQYWSGIVFITCDVSTILPFYPDEDLGTTVVQVSETPITLPSPNPSVTYELVGVTPCGDALWKTTTKTYSLRQKANQWWFRPTSVVINNSTYASFPITGAGKYYGNWMFEAAIAAMEVSAPAVPENYPPNFWTLTVQYFGLYIDPSNGTDIYAADAYLRSGGTWVHYTNYPAGSVQGDSGFAPMVYYLDMHETVTYGFV